MTLRTYLLMWSVTIGVALGVVLMANACRAMPFGPALSPSVEPVPVSIPSGLQSLSQGEKL